MFLTHKKINTEKTITNKLTLKHKHVCANTHAMSYILPTLSISDISSKNSEQQGNQRE